MRDTGEPTESRGRVTYWTMDVVVAAILMGVGALVMVGSYRLGAGWSPTGPESGYFPFYIGALILLSSTVTLLITLFTKSPDRTPFVESKQFQRVLQVLIPSFIFAIAIDYIGIYVAGGLFIAFFMWWLGKYPLSQGRHGERARPARPVRRVRGVVPGPPAEGPGRGVLRLLIASPREAVAPCIGWVPTTSARSPTSPGAIAGAPSRRVRRSAP